MNVYDFDQTIFQPDSSYAFSLFCLKKHPIAVSRALIRASVMLPAYKKGRISGTEIKEKAFSYLSSVKDADETVKEFWKTHFRNIESWYLAQKRDDDVIVSASPEFLLAPIAAQLGVKLIATRMDKHTGKISGLNCHDEEKVRRFREVFGEEKIEKFYSDSLTDAPMAVLAQKAYLVNKGNLSIWPR